MAKAEMAIVMNELNEEKGRGMEGGEANGEKARNWKLIPSEPEEKQRNEKW